MVLAIVLLGWGTGLANGAAANQGSAYESAFSLQVLEAADGGATIQWARGSAGPHLLGWHLDRQRTDGSVIRVTDAMVAADLFDSPATLYRVRDAAVAAKAGDTLAYRLVAVDMELREWPADFAAFAVAAEPAPAVAPPSAPKPPRGAAPALRDVTPTGSGSRLRIVVQSNGLYRLTSAQIAAGLAGFDAASAAQAIAQTNLALTCGGTAVAWRAEAGGAALLFYGQAYRDMYTDRNVYFLTSGPGLAMASSNRTTALVAADPWFWDTARMEKNLQFFTYLQGDPEDDFFMWSGSSVNAGVPLWQFTTNVVLPDLHPNMRSGVVTAHLASYYDGPPALDNHTKLWVAGQLVDDLRWAGDLRIAQSGTATNVASNSLSIAVQLLREADVTASTVLIDALEVRYARRMRALNDQLILAGVGTNVLTVRGFTTAAIRVFDLANPFRPIEVEATVAQEGAADWRVSWATPTNVAGRFLATAAPLQPERIEGTTPAWSGPMAGAPHLVIAPPALAGAAAALVAHRQQQGLNSVLVPLEELYDAYAFGRRDPRAIPRFLANALANWTVKPAYVCLAGDGHLDYYDNLNQAATRPNHVPPIHDRIPYTLAGGNTMASVGIDNPLADMDGDGKPEIAIGRLPAQTPAALTAMINRIVTHENIDIWKNKALLIADADANNEFGLACDRLAGRLPAGIVADKLYMSAATPQATRRANFIQKINAGVPLSVYLGHGNNSGMGTPSYFFEHSSSVSYMSSLTNSARTSVLLAGTCLLNDYAQPDPTSRCLGKGFLDTAPGGAVAVWASAAASSLYNSEATTAGIMDKMYSRPSLRLGDMIQTGLAIEAEGFAPWMVRCSVLMGDPGTRIRTSLYTPIVLQPTATNAPWNGTTNLPIAVVSDVAWTAATAQAWITIAGNPVGTNDGTVTVQVAANTGVARSGSVLVSGGGTTKTCRVDQAAAQVALTLAAEPVQAGTVLGAGTYAVGQAVQITASATSNWKFVRWNDGAVTNPRALTIPVGGTNVVATFEPSAGMWPSGNMIVVDRRPQYYWAAVPGATWYQIWVSRNGATYESIWVSATTTWTTARDYQGGQYQWWVQPWGPTIGMGAWSAGAQFTIPVGTPGSLAQIAPSGLQTGHNLTYRWQKHINATWYRLFVGRTGSGTWYDQWFGLSGTGEAAVVPGSTYPGPAKPIPTAPQGLIANNRPTFQWSGGQCEWWLQGWGPDGYGPWSGPKAFIIPHAAGTWHQVYVNRGSVNVINHWTPSTNLVSPIVLASSAHSWWLGVWDPTSNKTIWSERMDFTVQ